ncbi:MAG TPA: SAF domain-containing protein [Hyphomicrobiaceae bacterium]|jgi:predicted homoserine dehydrogenase-like protein|nr:SAF domain-containing protein [Hyphomicrobiaceae bacterium]
MSLSSKLRERAAAGRPIRIGQVGAGKFGTMFLSQVRLTPGMHLAGLADLMPERARERLLGVGWPQEQIEARSLADALKSGQTFVTDDALALIESLQIDVVVEATGDPATGIRLAGAAIAAGKHIVMVNVEADALAGPLLARRAHEAGVVYSLAWGDQPALICEQVDWARTCGFTVVAAGKGTRYHPSYHRSTPDTVWDILTQYLPIQDRSHINPKMFNSFLDGTKSGIEMTAVCNATGLVPQSGGLGFPPASRFELADVLKPRAEGGTLEKKGVTEVVSSLDRDGRDVPHHLAMGTYVVVESESPYAAQCFVEYHCLPDKSGRYAALYRPTHMIGLELGVSVASVALRGEPTGAPMCFNSDVVATAKRPLKKGEVLDGEGGFTVWGRQVPASVSLGEGYLPLGLASDVTLTADIAEGQPLRWSDVAIDASADAVKVRREMEAMFARPNQ